LEEEIEMRWIVALPGLNSKHVLNDVTRKYGFLSFPEFVDNFFIQNGESDCKKFKRILDEYGEKIEFAVLVDYKYDMMEKLMKEYSWINWIFPLHLRKEMEVVYKLDVEWVGFPRRKWTRDYSLVEFVHMLKENGFKKWYLGFMNERRRRDLFYFDGFDTTIPFYVGGKLGCLWLGWERKKMVKGKMRSNDIIELNIKKFREELEKMSNIECISLFRFGGD